MNWIGLDNGMERNITEGTGMLLNRIEWNIKEWIFVACSQYRLSQSSFTDIRAWTPSEQAKGDIGKKKV